ncbi:MAG: AbgT family transporter, partial [Dehalococcoidia bacterium]
MTSGDAAMEAGEKKSGAIDKLLGGIEKVGNMVPHPAIIFIGLCVLVIVLSAILALFNVSVTYDVIAQPPTPVEETDLTGTTAPDLIFPVETYEETDFEVQQNTIEIESLLTIDGIRFLFTSFVPNFAGFSVVSVIFVAMIGVGVAEGAGLMGALIRKLVAVAPAGALTFIIVFVGVLSSIATDAGYLILIPLGAAAFLSVGRHPLAGLAAAYAGVSVSFAVNALITPLDGLLTEVTNEAIQIASPGETIGITANLWFSIASSLFTAIVVTIVTTRMIEPRLGAYRAEPVDSEISGQDQVMSAGTDQTEPEVDQAAESRGLRYALYGFLGSVVVIALLTVIPGAPLRHPDTGGIIGDSPFMDSLVFLISIIFLVAGIGYGFG